MRVQRLPMRNSNRFAYISALRSCAGSEIAYEEFKFGTVAAVMGCLVVQRLPMRNSNSAMAAKPAFSSMVQRLPMRNSNSSNAGRSPPHSLFRDCL